MALSLPENGSSSVSDKVLNEVTLVNLNGDGDVIISLWTRVSPR